MRAYNCKRKPKHYTKTRNKMFLGSCVAMTRVMKNKIKIIGFDYIIKRPDFKFYRG